MEEKKSEKEKTINLIITYIQGFWSIFCLVCVIIFYGLFTTHDSLTSPLADNGD